MGITSAGKVLVTGAAGFIGSHFVRRLVREGADLVALVHSPNRSERLRDLSDRLELVAGEVCDEDSMSRLFKRAPIDVIYHLAAGGVRAETDGYNEIVHTNTLATISLARHALKNHVRRFVFVGSGFEYKPQDAPMDELTSIEPANFYGATKAAASLMLDQMRRERGLPLVVFRPFSVYGPREDATRFIPYVITQALAGKPMELTECTQVRDYLYVGDLAEALCTALGERAKVGEVYNLGAGPAGARPLRDVVRGILAQTHATEQLARFGAVERRRPEPLHFVADISKAGRELGWRPRTSIEEGIGATIEWYKRGTL